MFRYPRDSTEGLRQARILERGRELARSLMDGAAYYCYRIDGEVYAIYKRTYTEKPDTAYIVDMYTRKCSCPDYQDHQDACKHVVGLSMHLEEVEEEYSMLAYADMLDSAECVSGCDYRL